MSVLSLEIELITENIRLKKESIQKTETFANKLYEKANANGGSYGELEKCFSEDITDSAMVKASGKPAHHWYNGYS